ncbi:MAG: winged helix family two component transcriptional regulator [Actinomycetia bacterium]|nr:winged helix family two component transcriptional regulator [Actinomycetes bacterium]
MMTSVLIVDDETPFLRALGISLRARGYQVDTAATGEAGLQRAADGHPDVIVLDLGLPGMSGLDVLRELRAWSGTPVIVLSARRSEPSKVEALDLGADDYVTKPFGFDELLARLRAVVRKGQPGAAQEVVVTAAFSLDLEAKRVTTSDGDDVRLTPTEWGIVELLVRNRGKLVTKRQLLREVWGYEYEQDTPYLRVHLAAIRRKLEPDTSRPRYFTTEAGMGYRFDG